MPSRSALRLSILHRTDYRYQGFATSSYNEIRMVPSESDSQRLLNSSISVSPAASLFGFEDYFGTKGFCFDVQQPHQSLTITASSLVEVSRIGYSGKRVDRADLSSSAVKERYYEYLVDTPLTAVSEEVRGAAEEVSYSLAPEEAIVSITRWIRDRMRFSRGATHAQTSAMDALSLGLGVCQDFSHLAVSMLRAVGIPARYVSGYLLPVSEPERGVSAEGESHAWVEAWIGGWKAFDAANELDEIDNRYVKVGSGRDYQDVAPIVGIYTGASSGPPSVSVSISVI